jgi:two-component system response regulator RegA
MESGRLLILEDFEPQQKMLAQGLRPHFADVMVAGTIRAAITIASTCALAAAVIDVGLPDGNGVDLIPLLVGYHPEIRIVVLTGFGSYAEAVDSIKLGAVDFLAKPASIDQIAGALSGRDRREIRTGRVRSSRPVPLSLARVEWEYINRVLAESNGNISEAARRLGLRRQSLQRKLRTLPPPHPAASGSGPDEDEKVDSGPDSPRPHRVAR